ncbi:MAG: ABC transporter ATP-binding protein [Polyangiaceae bacterium]
MSVLEVKGLKTHFFTEEGVVKAVDGISIRIASGEVLGVVGESGSGKSVMSLSILRLIPDPPGRIVAGEILLHSAKLAGTVGGSVDLVKASEKEMQKVRGDRVAMIFQDPMTSLNPYMTVGKQLVEVLELHRDMRGREARKKAEAMLASVGIPDPSRRFDDYPHQLSGGMRQRVMIAMALLCDPELLIADEPTTALDVTIQAQILELIRERQIATGSAVILITHDLGVVARLADRVAVMYAGRIVEEGPAAEIFHNPQHPYTVGLARSIPRLDHDRSERLVPIAGMPPSLAKLPSGCPFRVRCPAAKGVCAETYPERRLAGGVAESSEGGDSEHAVWCHETDLAKVRSKPSGDLARSAE